jgi:nicotinamidase-related amidase
MIAEGDDEERSPIALLLVDVINDLEFPDAPRLLRPALRMAQRLARLKTRARRAKIPVIYVNDNFGQWRSDFRRTVAHCAEEEVRGRPIAQALRPDDHDYFVLKPRHSGFYCSALDVLLQRLGAKTVIVTGLVTEICVQATAFDAYIRDYRVIVPADCTATMDPRAQRASVALMKRALHADVRTAARLDLPRLVRAG